MRRCKDCGTVGALADLVPLTQINCAIEFKGLAFECASETECARRRSMNMGPLPEFPKRARFMRILWVTFDPNAKPKEITMEIAEEP